MIARVQNRLREDKDQGFTLIELLVVMIIIGILAAIAIPLFLTQREKAQDSAAKADVSTLGKELATYYVDNTGAVPTINVTGGMYYLENGASDKTIGNVSDNVTLIAPVGNASKWCVGTKNPEGDVAVTGYQYSSSGGLAEGDCTTY
ncbi:type II secretion system protein [Demequina sp. NBRC 110051]|uniref:type II secretion system protein n=1 Tax=Demequina sp. NBRC 110051 TaxID=1570340 RepID=UPI000A02A1E3|nr:prepilin-type N-terminal cleavage/methylation domain-containing protein [Demequina sp. NBRC 110051]